MVRATAGRVNEASGNTRDEELVVDEELDDRVELLLAFREHAIEFLGLWDCAGEAVQHESAEEGGWWVSFMLCMFV